MEFTGRIFFDFESADVWRLYQTALKASRDADAIVSVTWEEFLGEEIDREEPIPPRVRALAACAAVRDVHPDAWQRFNQAMLTLIFEQKDDPRKDATLMVAARVAGLDGDEVIARALDPGLDLLIAASEEARTLGVHDVPSVVRDGPPVHVRMTPAAGYGNAVYRLDLINRMLRDDAVWSLSKP
jgi:predicted DsbA family dithiol-disulfide isomerase